MKGLLADVNCLGETRLLLRLLQDGFRLEFWKFLNLATPTFAELGLERSASDRIIWTKCQEEELILITLNRNEDGPESLNTAIREHNTPMSLPVFTLANSDRILHDRAYAERTADKLLEDLFSIDNYRGAGRIYLP